MRGLKAARTIVVVCGALAWAASASAQKKTVKPAPPKQVTGKLDVKVDRESVQGFSVVLVLGDLQAEASTDNVPPAARRALNDMKDFLPYKSYRLLDTAWILGAAGTRATTRLRGSESQDYELTLVADVTAPPQSATTMLRMSFQLGDGSGPVAWAGPGRHNTEVEARALRAEFEARNRDVEALRKLMSSLEERRRDAEGQLQSLKERPDSQPSAVAEIQRRLDQLSAQTAAAHASAQAREATVRPGRKLIDTSFSMDIGETVVVGTSRLGGGEKALIALLTAVPRGKS